MPNNNKGIDMPNDNESSSQVEVSSEINPKIYAGTFLPTKEEVAIKIQKIINIIMSQMK